MNKKILNRVKQLSEDEKVSLLSYIDSHYCLEEKDGMLRDDIRDKVIEIMQVEFAGMEDVKESDELKNLNLDSLDTVSLSLELEDEFELEYINPDAVDKWTTVKDIVDYIEDNLGESDE